MFGLFGSAMFGSSALAASSSTISVIKTINFNSATGGADSGNETSATTYIAEINIDNNIVPNLQHGPSTNICW